MSRSKGATGQARVLEDPEIKQVLRVTAVGRHAKRNLSILILSHYLGLRAKELASLSIQDVYDGLGPKKTLRLVASYTKGHKHRDLTLEHKTVVTALTDFVTERKQSDGLAFNLESPLFRSQKGIRFSANSMVQLIGKLYAQAGFPDASSHSGRRSLITKLAYSGTDINSIRQIAGHTSIQTTQRYINDNPIVIANILRSI